MSLGNVTTVFRIGRIFHDLQEHHISPSCSRRGLVYRDEKKPRGKAAFLRTTKY